MNNLKRHPCKICGTPSDCFNEQPMEVDRCTNCWEVEKRIDLYLLSEKGHNNIRNKLFDLRYTVIGPAKDTPK